MGGKCCGLKKKKRSLSLPRIETKNMPIDKKVLYSDSHYFKEKQRKYYNNLLFEESIKESVVFNFPWERFSIIGTGSFGRVLLGKNLHTEELLAIKEIPLIGIENAESVCEEVEILSQLDHPNIVKCLGFQKDKEYLLIFMEFLPGGTVESLLKKFGPFSESLIKKYIKDILKGLEYLHYHNIVHRDLKGNNILIGENEQCKLADFGSAKNILGVEATGSVTGTFNWMAPEIICETGHGRFADIWGVGCLAVEMATGFPPWHQISNRMEMVKTVCETEKVPEIPEHYSECLKSFVFDCFSRNPYKRPNIAELLLHKFIVG